MSAISWGESHLALGLDRELAVPVLDPAGGQLQVLGLQRPGHVLHGEAEAGEPGRIDQHVDLALAPADQVDRADAGDALDAPA